jgi:hypothetical protein
MVCRFAYAGLWISKGKFTMSMMPSTLPAYGILAYLVSTTHTTTLTTTANASITATAITLSPLPDGWHRGQGARRGPQGHAV